MLLEVSQSYLILESQISWPRSPKWSASGPTMRRTATGAIILAEMRAIFCKNTQGTAQQPHHGERGWIMMGWDGKSREKRTREGEGDLNPVGGRTLHFPPLSLFHLDRFIRREICAMFLPEGKVKP